MRLSSCTDQEADDPIAICDATLFKVAEKDKPIFIQFSHTAQLTAARVLEKSCVKTYDAWPTK